MLSLPQAGEMEGARLAGLAPNPCCINAQCSKALTHPAICAAPLGNVIAALHCSPAQGVPTRQWPRLGRLPSGPRE